MNFKDTKDKYTFDDLVEIVSLLRAPGGCPWDREQTHESIRRNMLEEAYEAGARDFGENKVQEILEKCPRMPEDARFHMIGHLQRNKVKQVLPHAVLIHSVDSLRLAEQIDQEAEKLGITAKILLEVNVAKEESKFGMMPEEVPEMVEQISLLPHLQIEGLMTIAPFVDDPEKNRPVFQKL